MSTIFLALNAWREILARVFEGFAAQTNVSPEWLVNPATRRRLKLDYYYPDAGIAVRIAGLTAKGQPRQSDWDALEEEQRDQTRAEMCRQNGVQLFLIDPMEDPLKQLDTLTRLLSRASRMLAQSDRPDREKARWMPKLAEARERVSALRSRVDKAPEQMMANLAESWRDREAGPPPAPEPLPMPAVATVAIQDLAVGRRVAHERFGPGVITAREGDGAEAKITILFDGEQERTFLLALVQDKLRILS
ncbi:MAG: hypothetical protein QM346_02195 [Chloroflexota bacterium]|nr:hypothetical protein [Chloroflexota bacterium]